MTAPSLQLSLAKRNQSSLLTLKAHQEHRLPLTTAYRSKEPRPSQCHCIRQCKSPPLRLHRASDNPLSSPRRMSCIRLMPLFEVSPTHVPTFRLLPPLCIPRNLYTRNCPSPRSFLAIPMLLALQGSRLKSRLEESLLWLVSNRQVLCPSRMEGPFFRSLRHRWAS